jgi:uncharacterized protein (DUF952 family)
MPDPVYPVLVRIATRTEWERTQSIGMFLGELEMDGFIHLSNPNQVARVANAMYANQPNLMLLVIDRARVLGEIRDEDLNGLGEAFPHLYAALNLDAVTEILGFPVQPDGTFVLPVELE